ncbi:MAG: cytochrome oxidase subunit III [Proteobacteria bacterium]|nr:cytochrome oxidase subunit III [Pseudomonadota bacterium]MCP4916382.1 cytochrome oxidase subunit III [Pseudomonadota bacterium]
MSTLVRNQSTPTPTGRVALWWFLASEVAIFGGAVACYLLYRAKHPEWAEHAAHTVNAAGALNTVVLLSSSLTAVLAHAAAEKGDGPKAAKMLGLTVLGGLIFLCVKTWEYAHEIMAGYTPVENLFWSFYYLMTGLHAAHVIGGGTAIAIVALGARKGENLGRVELVALYWHFVDVVWIFLFPLLYLAN